MAEVKGKKMLNELFSSLPASWPSNMKYLRRARVRLVELDAKVKKAEAIAEEGCSPVPTCLLHERREVQREVARREQIEIEKARQTPTTLAVAKTKENERVMKGAEK